MKRSISVYIILGCLIGACDSSKSTTTDAAVADDAGDATVDSDATTPDTAVSDSEAPTDQSAESASDVAIPDCTLFPDRAEFVVTKSRYKAKADDERGGAMRIMYAANSDDPLFIRVMIWQGITGSPTGPSTIELQDVPRDLTGGVLLRFGQGCDDQGRDCTTDFVGFEGTLKIDSLDWENPDGSTFSGELTKVLIKQVTYDAAEKATAVPGGCSFTLDAHSFSGTVSTTSGGGN